MKRYEQISFIKEKANEFRNIMKAGDEIALKCWIQSLSKCAVQEFSSFANGLARDFDAVRNSFKYSFSNGLLEGHVNRLKTIKRIMYGRGKYDLIKSKVLFTW